jgi:fumarate reductase flavoprotein subunit
MNEELVIRYSIQQGANATGRYAYSLIIFTQADLDKLTSGGITALMGEETLAAMSGMSSRSRRADLSSLATELPRAIAEGQAWKADSLAALGEAVNASYPLNMDNYNEAIADYKTVVAAGNDPLFGKNPGLLYPLDNGPFYAVRATTGMDGTLNGISVSSKQEAQRIDGSVVKGLYVLGQDSGGFYASPYYQYPCSTMCYAYTSGMLCAGYIKEYLGK